MSKETKELIKRFESAGWRVEMTKSDHYRVYPTNSDPFTVPKTPSDYRSTKNALADAKRRGLEEDERRKPKTTVAQAFEEATMKQKQTNKGNVNGIAIVDISPMYAETPITRGKKVLFKDAEELLLEDGEIVYRCRKIISTGKPCYKVFSSVHKIRGHFTSHPKAQPEAQSKSEPVPKTKAEHRGVVAEVMSIASELNDLQQRLEKVIQRLPQEIMSPELLEKANKYDQIKRI